MYVEKWKVGEAVIGPLWWNVTNWNVKLVVAKCPTDKKLHNIETSVVKAAIVLSKMVYQVAKLEQKWTRGHKGPEDH